MCLHCIKVSPERSSACKRSALRLSSPKKQMSDCSDEDLPDVAVSQLLFVAPKGPKHVPYRFDLVKEIQLSRINRENELSRLKDAEEVKQLHTEDTDFEERQQKILDSLPTIDTIPDEAPGREFIQPGASFRHFDVDLLVKPPRIQRADPQDFLPFHQYVRSVLQDITATGTSRSESQEVLQYLLMLASVHNNEYLIETCTDLLLEFNADWEISHKFLLSIFQNWGADISQVLPSYQALPGRIVKDNPETVSVLNLNAVLSAQLKLRKRIDQFDVTDELGIWNIDELVFGLLILVGLDTKLIGCFRRLQDCVSVLLSGVEERASSSWASEYSESLLYLETDIYNLTSIVCRILNGSAACERLRVNVSFAGIQRICGIPLHKVNHSFDLRTFENLLASTAELAKLKQIDIYCLLLFVDTIVRDTRVSSEATVRSFYKWLMRFNKNVERKPHLCALISNFSIVWDDETSFAK